MRVSEATELADGSTLRLVDLLLEEQQSLTAVERFAERHEADDAPLQARYYRDLIPSARPGEGQQYAFRVDLDSCTGCKACVTACHSLNGLDEGEAWRDVGLLIGEDQGTPYQQTVTTACHHCEDPGCLSGCPVQAYEKDAETGIVRHLDDQCIGCQYCVLKCPYDVPKYNAKRGIVRKCDMCTDRLAVGEAPACVQGCPNGAISIEIVDQGLAPGGADETLLALEVGGMPSSSLTRPTTRYTGKRPSAAFVRPADTMLAPRAEAHMPLVAMMIAVQLSLGLLLVDFAAGLLTPEATASLRPFWALAAAAVGIAGQAGAFLHLGRPQFAFRAFLGWRTSWMSREILVLGPFAGLVAGYAGSLWLAPVAGGLGMTPDGISFAQSALGVAALATGALGTFCSVMIYADTSRPFWSLRRSGLRFFGTALVLGPAAALALTLSAGGWAGVEPPKSMMVMLVALCVGSTLAKLGAELAGLRHLRDSRAATAAAAALERSALLLIGPLRGEASVRVASALLAILCLLPLSLVGSATTGPISAGLASAGFTLLLFAELTERRLFFRAEAARAMPGPA